MIINTPAKKLLADINMEVPISTRIPYTHLIDPETVETKSGHLLQTIKLNGLYAETLDDQLIDHEKHIRNFLWMSLVDSSTSLYFHTIRKKVKHSLSGSYASQFSENLHNKYQETLKAKEFYINEHYITVVKKPPVGKIRRISDVWFSLTSKANKQMRDAYRARSHKDLNKITSRILESLRHYDARKLSQDKTHSKILSFLSELINLTPREIIPTTSNLAYSLSYKRMFFDKNSGTIALRDINNRPLYAAILSIKDYVGHSGAGFLDAIFDLPAEFTLTQTFSFLDKQNAREKIKEQMRNLVQSDDGITSESDKIYQALDELGSSVTVTGEHHLSFLVKEKNLQTLEEKISLIDASLNQLGLVAIREDKGIKPAFFATLPGNHAYIARRATISSKNLAGFVSLHNSYSGKVTGNYWGDAVTILETVSGSPFYFNFHVLDVGNTFLIGPQGSGKTALEAFLISQSMKFGGRNIYFDKDRGLEIYVRAEEGVYLTLKPGIASGFAPFQMNDTIDNRAFLIKLLRKIATVKGQPLKDEEDLALQNAVEVAYTLPKCDRVLRNLLPSFGPRREGSLRMRFESWANDGEYAWVFDNKVDEISLQPTHLGFDMTEILKDPVAGPQIYFYLFHRIEQGLDGTRTRIVAAEGWCVLQDPVLREQIRDWSSTPRKKEAFLIIDTQSPQDISQSEIGCKIIQESATQIYFANPKATRVEYMEKFGLSEKEFQTIKTIDKNLRYFLLKQAKHSVLARLDLNRFTDEMAVLSGRTAYSKLLDSLRANLGNHPNQWLQPYYGEVKKIGSEI